MVVAFCQLRQSLGRVDWQVEGDLDRVPRLRLRFCFWKHKTRRLVRAFFIHYDQPSDKN